MRPVRARVNGRECIVYDERGWLLTGTFMDFLIPTAMEVPDVEVGHIETPSPLNPLGVKGVGEAGAIPVPALIAEAVDDALSPWGVRVREMPLSPGAILALLDHAPRRPDCGSPPSEGHSRPARSDAPPKRPAAHCPSGSGQP